MRESIRNFFRIINFFIPPSNLLSYQSKLDHIHKRCHLRAISNNQSGTRWGKEKRQCMNMHGQHQVLFSLLHEQKGKVLAGKDPAAFKFTPNTPLKFMA
ncbi:hypothetical protein EYC84_001877 [Monilinia fructicola]|uniref:Uncharacterized protein n=1 Tax=Monilinia fructicola TaxID=38448 RepID=A0A5M9JTI7_MONFR|nr:hypothetical protein EYC84_001877 [Monilinia fructicola]